MGVATTYNKTINTFLSSLEAEWSNGPCFFIKPQWLSGQGFQHGISTPLGRKFEAMAITFLRGETEMNLPTWQISHKKTMARGWNHQRWLLLSGLVYIFSHPWQQLQPRSPFHWQFTGLGDLRARISILMNYCSNFWSKHLCDSFLCCPPSDKVLKLREDSHLCTRRLGS